MIGCQSRRDDRESKTDGGEDNQASAGLVEGVAALYRAALSNTACQ